MVRQTLQTLTAYLRAPASRSAEDFGDAIQEEIVFHVARRAEDYMARGMNEEEAEEAAMNQFGDASRIAAACHAEAVGALVVWHRLHLGVTAALLLAVGLLWTTMSRRIPILNLPTPLAAMMDNDWNGDIEGQVLDDMGNPIEQAHVLVVVKTWPDQSYFQRAYAVITDGDGCFEIENVHPLNERYEVQVSAIADRRGLQSAYHSQENGTLEPIIFELSRSSGLSLQIQQARGGSAMADVEVLPQGRTDSDGAAHHVYFDAAQPMIQRTNQDGIVQLPYFEPGDTATIMLRTAHGQWETRSLVVPPDGQVATIRAHLSSQES